MMKAVSVVRRRAEFIVMSYTQAPAGFWQMNGHFSRVPVDVEAKGLGSTVLEELEASNQIALRDVGRSANPFAPVLAALGLKSFAQYMKGAVSVDIAIGEDGGLRVTPMRNEGARGGFVEITEDSSILADSSAEALGAAVEEAMAKAR